MNNGTVTASLKTLPYYSGRSQQPSASSSRASSVQGSPPQERLTNGRSGSSDVELERANLKIKTLQREVRMALRDHKEGQVSGYCSNVVVVVVCLF